jgi:hypothetical protein
MASTPVAISMCRTQSNVTRGSALEGGSMRAESRRRAMLRLYPASGHVDR